MDSVNHYISAVKLKVGEKLLNGNPMKKMILFSIFLTPLMIYAQEKCSDERFAGHDRKASKTVIVQAKIEGFNTIPSLLKTLPSDDEMRGYDPPISKAMDSERVEEEQRNVTVRTAYIFLLYRESDNDYHIIIGSNPDTSRAVLMNIEVSGLPDQSSPDYQALKEVRKSILDKFGKICSSKKFCFDHPVKISVTGSLFYDVDHKPGIVGYKNCKPKTAWEIHPVTQIVFKDKIL